jgi:arsenate reductase
MYEKERVPSVTLTRRSLLQGAALIPCAAVLGAQDGKVPQVLFLCPHGAAKSVLASSYFKALAAERGLRVRVDFAGTEPDPQIAPRVKEHLRQQGLEVSSAVPRQVTAADVGAADIVISLGCDLSRVPGSDGKRITQWDVPGPGEHFDEADAEIRRRVTALVDELMRQRR